MSATKQIPRDQLQPYFDAFSKRFGRTGSSDAMDIELISPEVGDQRAADGARLAGIAYDPHDDALDIMLELARDQSADHRIVHPREVWVVEEPDGFVSSMEVVRADGAREIATLRKGGVRRAD